MPGILLDIEGTTTPIRFVYDILFPFARRRMREYVRNADLRPLRNEYEKDVQEAHNPPDWTPDPVPYIYWLMDQDRKSTALKDIQGKIWLEGYETGELHGEVFPDVPPALQRWHQLGKNIRIFSSGSVLAQRLLFSTTDAGDLTRFMNGFYDTTTGPKNDQASYSAIAKSFGTPASDILFLSDVTRELDAAREAGMRTLL